MTDHETNYSVVLTTTDTAERAEALARKIVESKLAACVQIQQIRSVYTWKGETCAEPEFLMLIKGRQDLFSTLEQFIRANHTYETPEIVQVPITRGFAGYLDWISEVTRA
jgi:periplasmic divalent cation tolerance protein